MSWNYRIILSDTGEYCVHEVYYDKKTKKPNAWSENPISPLGETIKELEDDLRHMHSALSKPILKVVDGKLVVVDEPGEQSPKTR